MEIRVSGKCDAMRVKTYHSLKSPLCSCVSWPSILRGEHSGLLTRTAATEGALSCTLTKSSPRLLNSNVRC